jgi:hypothetical protein
MEPYGASRAPVCYCNQSRPYVALAKDAAALSSLPSQTKTMVLPDEFNYLADGDVLRLWPKSNGVRVLYRRNSFHNHFLPTELCNHYCLMCSQPPKNIDDSWIVDDVLAAIPLIDPSTQEIGFTGGEPTLLGDDFFRILQAIYLILLSISSQMVGYSRHRNLRSATPTFGILI